jgi:hypothetical protein
MKLRLGLVCLFLLAATAARAQQLFINFEDCSAAGYSKTKMLNCSDPNAVTRVITSVYVGSADLPDIIADAGIVDVAVGYNWGPTMPAFWQFHPAGCGAGNFLFSSDFVAGPYTCYDLWAGRAAGGGQYGGLTGPNPDGNRARVKYTWAVTPDAPARAPGNTETYICRMTLRQSHLTDCSEGCGTPVCAVYHEEALLSLNGTTYKVTNPDYVIFNSYLDLETHGRQVNCLHTSPAAPATWGQVKALYR